MNDADFIRRLEAAAPSIDESRWALAELAADCKRDEYEHWAERIGNHKKVKRSVRTVREWAQTAEFRSAIGTAIDLPFSFYSKALRYVDKVTTEQIVELMGTAADEGVSLEEFGAALDKLQDKPPVDWTKKWRKMADTLFEQVDTEMPPISGHLRQAALELSLAVEEKLKANKRQQAVEAALDAEDDADLDREWDGPGVEGGPSLEDDLSEELVHATNQLNASGDGTMEARLYRHGRLVAGPAENL